MIIEDLNKVEKEESSQEIKKEKPIKNGIPDQSITNQPLDRAQLPSNIPNTTKNSIQPIDKIHISYEDDDGNDLRNNFIAKKDEIAETQPIVH